MNFCEILFLYVVSAKRSSLRGHKSDHANVWSKVQKIQRPHQKDPRKIDVGASPPLFSRPPLPWSPNPNDPGNRRVHIWDRLILRFSELYYIFLPRKRVSEEADTGYSGWKHLHDGVGGEGIPWADIIVCSRISLLPSQPYNQSTLLSTRGDINQQMLR